MTGNKKIIIRIATVAALATSNLTIASDLSRADVVNVNADYFASRDVKLDKILSSSGPLVEFNSSDLSPVGINRMPRSTDTYTYLRCYYRVSEAPIRVALNRGPNLVIPDSISPDNMGVTQTHNYEWAVNSSGDYYRLNGYWRSNTTGSGVNVFIYYTSTSLKDVQEACVKTLASKKPGKRLAKVFAANNKYSYDYDIWVNGSMQDRKIDRIVSFGDSLSDTHNIYNIADWLLPSPHSWSLGRFSNGKIWTEYMADNLSVPLYNWAVGSSGVSDSKLQFVKGILEQVDSFFETTESNARDYEIENTLFTIFTGSNDVMTYGTPANEILAKQERVLKTLIAKGARYIIIMKIPDVTRTPRYVSDKNTSEIASNVRRVNNGLSELVARLTLLFGNVFGDDAPRITLFDTSSKFDDVLNNPIKYNMVNVTNACLNGSDSDLNYFSYQKQCDNPDGYVFWDYVHPTTRTHKLLGDAVTEEFIKTYSHY
ncbi:SGNH/GDSL hydrolase family protein [Burkholderia ubonensis]|uniref:SGNH/GDSL hydrolase family protein n=1 Tax=Burkholderia ubonensis TaxID=101571 RepID=UPI0009B4918A|nr:SGNH/GDSL hydrolase family protein [Burkholderia ubonensis]